MIHLVPWFLLALPSPDALAAISRTAAERELAPRSPALVGALVGGGAGLGAGLLFVHEACDDDPCSTFAYVLGAATGAAGLGLSGALIGSRANLPQPARRNAWIGTAIGGVIGAAGGIALMAATCDPGDCGPAGYVSFPLATGGVLAGVGGFVGSLFGR